MGMGYPLSRRRYRDIDEIEQEILAQVRVTMDEIYEAIGVKLLEKGKAEGKTQGIFEGEKNAVIIFWQKRFGPLSAEVTAALAAATEAQLHSLLEGFAASLTEAEARKLLGL